MIVEPNPFHGEVVLGIVHYFNLLGYRIKLYIRKELMEEKLVTSICFDGEVSIIDIENIDKIFSYNNTKEYDFVFFTSLEYQNEEHLLVDFISYYKLNIKTKYGILGIYHTISFINIFGAKKLAEEGRIFCLSEFQKIISSVNVLNPHCFKNSDYISESYIKKAKTDLIKIAILGNMLKPDIIAKAMKKLSTEEQKKIIVYHTGGQKIRGIDKVIKRKLKSIIYRFLEKLNDRWEGKAYETRIIEMGRLNFPDLFNFLKQIDYLLLPLDYHTYEGMHYISVSTSGTKQISLGMNIPIICNEIIGEQYGFNEYNAILYAENHLEIALRKILSINIDEQNGIKKNLKETAQQIEKMSLENLRNSIVKLTI